MSGMLGSVHTFKPKNSVGWQADSKLEVSLSNWASLHLKIKKWLGMELSGRTPLGLISSTTTNKQKPKGYDRVRKPNISVFGITNIFPESCSQSEMVLAKMHLKMCIFWLHNDLRAQMTLGGWGIKNIKCPQLH